MNRQPLELYIHIPFCVQKCQYCDFLSYGVGICGSAEDQPVPDSYLDALCREIKAWGERPEFKYRPVTTVFFGGGTPSLMTEKQIFTLISLLRENFRIRRDAEITMEANPGTISREKLRCMHFSGVNRLSIGLQSADEKELKILGRIHGYGDFLQSFEWAREAGFKNINVDLISSVPGQTKTSYEETLKKVLELKPEHISAYSLIIEPGTPFELLDAEGKLQLPDEDEEREMYHLTQEYLSKAGYIRYEISNYAKPGFECQHNIGYWQRKDYLGLGLGASSLIGNKRFSNARDMHVYTEGDRNTSKWYSEMEVLADSNEMEEFMFLGLRMTRGIREKDFYIMFRKKIMDVYGAAIQKNIEKGLLRRKNGYIYLTSLGLDLANSVMSDFIFG